MSARRSTVSEGDVLAGKYRVERTLSSGGMGVVVAAQHLELHELVCLKLMHGANAATPDETERFLREARAAAKLRDEHVCRVMDVDRLDDGTPFIVMEMLKGSDLAQVLRARGTLDAPAAAAIVVQACIGLGEAHDAGIVHRDIKPSNLFVTRRRDGSRLVKLLDFGISKATAVADVTITQPEQMIGTPAYMSPEQMRSATSVDVRTDVWGLGAVLFELVTGRLPFPGSTSTEVIANVLTGALDLTAVPGVLAPIVARCLDKDRERRYPSVAALADDLAPIAATATDVDLDTARTRRVSQRPLEVAATIADTGPSATARSIARKPRSWLAAAAVAGAIAAAAVVFVVMRGHDHVAAPHRGGTLRVAMGYEDSGFDLYSILRSRNRGSLSWVMEPLLRRTDDGAAEPWILDRTELRDGGRTLVLHVRPDVWFHDHPCLPGGHRVTAADIAYSLRVAIDRGQMTLPIKPDKGITAHGDDEVIVTLDGVNSFYESELASVFAIPHEVEGCDDIRAMHRPVGTGPFQFKDEPHGTRWHLVRAPKYWRRGAHGEQLPYLDGLELGPIRDVRESLSQLSRGEIDLMMEANEQWDGVVELRGVRPTLAPAYAALQIQVAASSWNNRFGLMGVFVGSRSGPLADLRVRTALALALDRPALAAAAGHPVGAATGRFFSARMWGYEPTLKGFTYDPDRARALVKEIGALPPITLATMREGAMGRVLVEQAAAVGLEVQLVMINTKVDEALKQEDGLLGGVTADMFDGEIPGYLEEINFGKRSQLLVDLQKELVGTVSRPDRFNVYRRIEQALMTEVPMIPIAFSDPMAMRDDQVFLVGMRVRGFADDVTGFGGPDALATSWVDP